MRNVDPLLVLLACLALCAIVGGFASLDATAHEPTACVCPAPPPCAVAPAELLEQIEAATATIESTK